MRLVQSNPKADLRSWKTVDGRNFRRRQQIAVRLLRGARLHRIDRSTHHLSSGDLISSPVFAQRLASGAPFSEPVALLVAHADDETLGAGSAIPRLSRLTLVHLTDSAPVDMEDAVRLGF